MAVENHFDSTLYMADDSQFSHWIVPKQFWNLQESQENSTLHVYAYRAIPMIFGEDGRGVRMDPKDFHSGNYPDFREPDLSLYDLLGYDVVEYHTCQLVDLDKIERSDNTMTSTGRGHSPLSCNGLADQYPVNSYCLLDNMES
ncbi:MAG: hypothetical protein KDA78_03235, partial [Planctomycetaceae bacterium]|nr:hypothetical protein [Planctomycetaceae bacterium]